jgi:DNA-binding transcriptional ArsR family regulator
MAVLSKTKDEVLFDPLLYKKVGALVRTFNNPVRQKILKYLSNNSRVPVSTIYSSLKMEQSVASQHLALLRKYELVLTTRNGTFIYYSINFKRLKEINQLVSSFRRIL